MAPAGPRVVIVGGGFGGLYAAAYLARSELADQGVQVALLDRKNYFTFTPLLAEVVGGTLGREHVTYPYRVLARQHRFAFVQDAAREVDLAAQCVRTDGGAFPFDFLLFATGAEPTHFGQEAIRRHSLPLTSVPEALRIRDRVIAALERAVVTRSAAERERLLTFVVAGAGPAGVEVASEIHHMCNRVLRPYYPGLDRARVLLVDPSEGILRGFDAGLAEEGVSCLRRRGLEVHLGTRVSEATAETVTLAGADGPVVVPTDTLIWTAGTAPSSAGLGLPFPLERGALPITETLQITGQENVFAVGDTTVLRDPRTEHPYPRVAPIAISQGVRAAGNIESLARGRPLDCYHAHHAGKIISLGHGVALVDILGFQIRGPIAWWFYRTAYLLKLVGTKNKIRVVMTLVLNRLFGPDVTAEVPAPTA